jgi:hypothetical protein
MQRPVSAVLDRLAQRCLALGASMLATTLESLQVAQFAEQQSKLEDLAKTYESEGLTEIATSLRERAKLLKLDRPADNVELLFSHLSSSEHPTHDTTSSHLSPSLLGDAAARRLNGRPKRGKSATTEERKAESDASAGGVFFPLTPPPADSSGQEGTAG